jgi:hypothetical protein
VPEPGTTILGHEVKSQPARGVPHSVSTIGDEIHVNDISLTRDQELQVDFYTKSSSVPTVRHYFSGGGEDPPTFEEASRQTYQGVERHIDELIRNYILSIVAPTVIVAVGSVLVGAVSLAGAGGTGLQIGTLGFLQVLGALVNAYFLLRIIPPALALVRILINRRTGEDVIVFPPSPTSEESSSSAAVSDATSRPIRPIRPKRPIRPTEHNPE